MTAVSPPRSPVVRRRAVPARPGYGRSGLYSSAYGRMGSGIFAALGVVAVAAGGLTPLAVAVAGLVVAAVAASYAEGMGLFPEPGGPAALARHAFDELASFATGWVATLALAATAALAALFAARYLGVFWGPLASGWTSAAGALVVLALVGGAAARGLRLPAGLPMFAGAVDLGLQGLLVILGAAFALRPEALGQDVHLGTAPSLGQLALACALATAAFTGVEAIGDMAAEARDPDRDVAPAAVGVLISAVTLATAVSLVAVMAASKPGGAHPGTPVLAIAAAMPLHVLAAGTRGVVGLLVAVLLTLVAHTALGRGARLLAWEAQHRQLPAALGSVDPVRQAPVAAVAACSAGAAGLVAAQAVGGGARLLAALYAFAALLAFTGVHASVLALRWRDPGRYRPLAVPPSVTVRGRRLPLVAIIGIAGTICAWLALIAVDGRARLIGPAWLLIGLAGYAVHRRRQGLSLSERAPREPAAAGAPRIEVGFQTMLIPVNTAVAGAPDDLLDVAAQLAAERRASVVLLAFTEIPLGEEMDLEVEGLDETVERLAATGRAVGDRYGIRVLTTHLRTRDPAESILSEANRRDSQAILLGAAGLQRSSVRRVAYDHAVRRIVAEAHQRVMIVRPEQAPA
jgi:APA family basic amino acid/polyamine antiporter